VEKSHLVFCISQMKLIVVALLLLLQSVAASTPQLEIAALERLYNSTGGSAGHWNFPTMNSCISDSASQGASLGFLDLTGASWDFKRNTGGYELDPCAAGFGKNFAGIGCTCTANQVCSITQIGLPCGNLAGSLRSVIAALKDFTLLSYLDVDTNALTGTIPLATGEFAQLQMLVLFTNSLTGAIPRELGNLANLVNLDLDTNSLAGTIPRELGNLTKLEFLDLNNNSLTGAIPRELGNLENLEYLNLNTNALTGTIPRELGNLTKLESLFLKTNALTGTIPRELGNLTKLEYLFLKNNLLTGTIPHELGMLANLKWLDLYTNSLTGTLPRELGNLTKLRYLVLASNLITGTIPHELGNLASLEWFNLGTNSLAVTIPRELGNLIHLEFLDLNTNSLTGTIPCELGNLAKLEFLSLKNNSLTGSIPRELGNLTNLEYIFLSSNLLTGCITSDFRQLVNLTQLDFSYNFLTGTIPPTFAALSKLESLVVQNNKLQSSSTDADIFNFINPLIQRRLAVLDVSSNNFSGSIPASVFLLSSLSVLFAGSNCFGGTLPSNICDATNLVKLDLSSLSSGPGCRKYIWAGLGLENVFTGFVAASSMQGSLPSCLLALPRLQVLSANGNQFPGELPMAISPSLDTISLSRNMIFGTISELLALSANLNKLDLSYNRISGSLNAFASSSDEQVFTRKGMQLQLQVNHMSGNIPNSLRELKTVNILSGNVFACSGDANELPIHDPGFYAYQCGSNDMDSQMYVFGAVLLVGAMVVLCMRHLPGMQRCSSTFKLWLRVATGRKLQGYVFASAQMMRYTRNLQSQRVFACMIGVATIVSLICYVSLSGSSDKTVGISYSWVATVAYLTGPKSTAVLLSCGISYISYIWFLIYLDEWVLTDGSTLDSATIVSNEDGKSTLSTRLRTAMLPALRLLVFISIIWGVMVGGNYWYIIIQFNGSTNDQQIFQLCFAAFKLFWLTVATPYVFESEALHFGVDLNHHDTFVLSMFGGNYQLLFVMNIFTSFLIPMLTIAVVDDTCFYNMFYQTDPVTTSIFVDATLRVGTDTEYLKNEIRSTTFTPFTYGYTCSDSIMRIYIPLYMQMSILLVLKSMSSLIYLCWDTYETENALEDAGAGKLHVFMNWLKMLTPTQQLLYGNNRRRAEYDSGRVFKSNFKLWITRHLPGNLANMVMLLSFGFAAPALAVMSVTNIVMDSFVCQLVLGRFIESEISVLLEGKRQMEDIADAPMKPEGHFVSSRRLARMQEAIKDVDEPWGALAALKEVEAQCEHVHASALARGRTVFVLITSAVLAMLLVDVDNSTSSQQSISAGASIAMISFALTLVFLTSIYNTAHINSETSTRQRNEDSLQQGIEMRDAESASDDDLKNCSTNNPIMGSTFTVDEIPSAS